MSNILTTMNFLNDNPDKHFIVITNQENGNPVGNSKIYLRDIANGDLKKFIKYQIEPITKNTLVWVELRKENGSSSSKVNAFPIEVIADNVQNAATITTVAAPVVHEATPFLGNPNNQFGLGLPEILKMNTDAAMLVEVRAQLEKAKEEIKELKHDNRTLDLDLREQKTKVATAEQQKELAVMLATANTKGFFDGDGFQKLLEKAPDMMEKFAMMKNGQAVETSSLGNPDMSDVQKTFVDYVIENLTDDQVNLLGGACHFIKDENFISEFTELLVKYKNLGV